MGCNDHSHNAPKLEFFSDIGPIQYANSKTVYIRNSVRFLTQWQQLELCKNIECNGHSHNVPKLEFFSDVWPIQYVNSRTFKILSNVGMNGNLIPGMTWFIHKWREATFYSILYYSTEKSPQTWWYMLQNLKVLILGCQGSGNNTIQIKLGFNVFISQSRCNGGVAEFCRHSITQACGSKTASLASLQAFSRPWHL